MDENLGKFIENFARLVELAQSRQHRMKRGTQLLDTLTDHLAVKAESVAVVVEEIPPHRFVDADILMEELTAEDAEFRLVGIGGGDQRHHNSLSDMLQQSQLFPQYPLSQPDYTNLAVGPDQQRQAVALGLWLFSHDGSPIAVLQRDANPRYGRQSSSLEVLAGATDKAAHFLSEFRRRMQHRSVLKGQVISLVMGEYGSSGRGDLPRPAGPCRVRCHPAGWPAGESVGPHVGHRRAPGIAQQIWPAPQTRSPALRQAGDR